MPFFEVSNDRLNRMSRISLGEAEVRERRDLQRLLREHLPEIAPGILIIAEEFGDWDDSKRRIDLLGLDRKANLVVIELKRGDTGTHMELQALRYAAMVSTMTFDQAVSTYERHLGAQSSEARQKMLAHLSWAESNEDEFAQDVRIILFSEDYSRELTTSILWLLDEKNVDITCFRVGAYKVDGRLLLEFQQIIPLKEAEEYQVKVRNKQQVEQTARRAQFPWNGEFYANYGDSLRRSWEDAQKYGFISAGGSDWFTRTLRLLPPGARVWVNRPGTGYLGVGIVLSGPVPVSEFMVDTESGKRLYLEVSRVATELRSHAGNEEKAEHFVSVRWLSTVEESAAIKATGFFGNQNSVAKPTTAAWDETVNQLKDAFGIDD